jgi:hypothetical protein
MLRTRHGDVAFDYKNSYLTIAYFIPSKEGAHPLTGNAVCSVNDQFRRRVGRKRALARALNPLPRPVRREIWEDLWAQGVGK